ncbi:hypothetical protein HNR60_002237 [Rhodopseudomonas rhenobacensis]|uniref:Uncharacterized protein n=1 Tax=Rhodopseudomonas rhenobacensis TaxID=87461 RepID=A0A7W7Z3R9_9BRAD|nr:hypothetical protein [Rhodopseudomonas rhenobacensis]MBB5047482.1 hypothetical protein [Rhodopseudomonas rhenobacensis]
MPDSAANEAISDRLDDAADAAIAACGGDLRSTIRALILANEYLEFELGQCNAAVSRGFARGRHGGAVGAPGEST